MRTNNLVMVHSGLEQYQNQKIKLYDVHEILEFSSDLFRLKVS